MAGGSTDARTAAGYEDLVHRAALHHDRSRRVFRVSGDRAPGMLQGLITADISEPGDGAAWPTLILTPKGRVLADAVVLRVDGELLLDLPEAAWAGLEPHFGRYLPPRFAKLEPTSLRVLRIRGPYALERAAAVLPELGSIPPTRREEDEGVRWGAVRCGEGFAVGRDEPGAGGIDLLLPAAEGSRPAPGLELPTASPEAWEIWRVERGIPLYGRDVSEDNLPQETGLVAEATSFSKGCYTGQEVLARIHYRGKVNRHLRGLRVPDSSPDRGAESTAGGPPLAAGDELRQGERVVGAVTSAVRSPRFGLIGLGYLRREVEPGDEVAVRPGGDAPADGRDEATARVVGLPFD
ncbi:MAG: YgfZ/GcvT domain-containing protein [Gemmatimonadota bacterium]